MKTFLKYAWMFILLANTSSIWAHKEDPPCNDESLDEAREKARQEKEKEKDHGHNH